MPIPFDREQIRQATLELIARNGLRSCYIRPLVFRGYGTMGLFPLEAPRRRRDRRLGVGRLPRRGGQAQRHPREGLLLAAHQPRLADPAREGRRASTSTACSRRSSRTRPATRRRSCSTTTATSARAPARTSTSCATASSTRRRRPPRSSTASTAARAIQIARDLGFEVVERDIARAELYLADEVFLTGHRGRARARARDRRPHDRRRATPGEITRAVQSAFDDALHGRTERYREWLDPVPVRRRTAERCVSRRRRALRRHPARRHGRRRHVAHRRGEAARRARARRRSAST